MKHFFKMFNIFLEKYSEIFHQEFRHNYKTNLTQYRDVYILSFGFLKVIDCALKHSKHKVIEKYENNPEITENELFNTAIFPDGEKLGFYNTSGFDLNSLSINRANIVDNFNEYMNGFNDDVKLVFKSFEFETMIEFLAANDMLFDFIKGLNDLPIPEYNFKSFNNLKKVYEKYLQEFYDLKEFNDGRPSGIKYNNFSETFLINILLNNVNLKKRKEISIFDPGCGDGYLLFETKKRINEINPDCNVKLFGKELDLTKYAICISKAVIDKENVSNFTKTDDRLSQFTHEMGNREIFDFIISDFVQTDFNLTIPEKNDLNPIRVFSDFYTKIMHNGKMVITISSDTLWYLHPILTTAVYMDKLEVVLSLNVFHEYNNAVVLVFNANKNKKRRGKFLLLDDYSTFAEKDIHTNFAKDGLNRAYNLFNNFKDDLNTYIIHNSEIKSKFVEEQLFKRDEVIKKSHERVQLNPFLQDDSIEKADLEFRQFYDSNFVYHFNFNNLIYNKTRFWDEDNIPVDYLGNIADLKEDLLEKSDSNSLLIPKSKRQNFFDVFANNRIAKYNEEIDYLNPNSYIECIIKTDDVLIDYLYYYLNSNKGSDEVFHFSRGSQYFMVEDLNFIRVPIPDIEKQKEIVNAVKKSNEFFDSVNLLKDKFQNNILDYEHILDDIDEFYGDIEFSGDDYKFTKMGRNWKHVWDGLLWPLAITYLSATKGGFEIVQKANAYLKLFEFVSMFNCIILISGLPDELYQRVKDRFIWNKEDYFYNHMTFGKWNTLYRKLKKVYQKNEVTPLITPRLFSELLNEKVINILEFALEVRNVDAHGPITTTYEAEEAINQLDPILSNLFDILKCYSGFDLYYITGRYERTESGNIEHTTILLNGPCNQPIYDKFNYNKELDARCLYLYNSLNGDLLKINDKLMKFETTDRIRDDWALFIYCGWDEDERNNKFAEYRCYQQTEDDLKIPISSFSGDIK